MEKIVTILKRPQVWGFFLSLAVLALISLAFFYPDNFEGRSLQQPDMQQGAANGHEAMLFQQQTGEKALWTNSLFGGMPTFQISPSYESNSLFTWINSLYGMFLPSPSNLLMMMMTGFLILMFALGKRWYYALIGAIAWGFSSYFIIIIGAGHIWKFITLAYVPPTIAGIILLYRGRYLPGAALTALFAMMQLNANHPQMSYYFAIVMALISLAYLIDKIRKGHIRSWLKATAIAAGAGILAVGANAPSLYNTYKYSLETQRQSSELSENSPSSGSGMESDAILGWSYGRSETFSLLVPNVKGGASARPEGGRMVAYNLNLLPEAAVYMSVPGTGELLHYLPQYFNDSEGTNGPVYVGAIVFALFLMGCFIVRGPLKWALVAASAISIILAWGYNAMGVSQWMIANFPMYNKFRAVESILVVAEFAMPLLGVLALSQFIEAGKDALAKYKKAFIGSFGFSIIISGAAAFAPSVFGAAITSKDMEQIQYLQSYLVEAGRQQGASMEEINALLYEYSLSNPQTAEAVTSLRQGLVRSDGLRSLLFLAIAGGMLAFYGAGRCRRGLAVGAVGILVLADLYGVDKRYVSSSSFGAGVDASSQGIAADEIDNAILQDGNGHYRVLDVPGFSSARRSYFHSMVGGYHAAKLSRTNDVVSRLLMPSFSRYGYTKDSLAPEQARAAARFADLLNARYIITGNPAQPVIRNTSARGNAWFVDTILWTDTPAEEFAIISGEALDLRTKAVADSSFRSVLGEAQPIGPGDDIFLTSYTPNEIQYGSRSTLGGVAVFSEVYFPWGWTATIDGEETPIGRADYLLRAIRVPAGEHSIVLSFNPASVRNSVHLAYAAVTLIYMLVALAIFVEIRKWHLF